MSIPRTHYRVPEFCEATGVPERTVRRLIASGELPSRRLGGLVLIPADWDREEPGEEKPALRLVPSDDPLTTRHFRRLLDKRRGAGA